MVSAALLHHHPTSHTHTHRPRNERSNWQMPAIGIERLLELSESVPLDDGELTPVQAWDKLRRHPEFGSLEVERLKTLEQALLKGVKCYG